MLGTAAQKATQKGTPSPAMDEPAPPHTDNNEYIEIASFLHSSLISH